MPSIITMVCLADSRKNLAHCVAGKIVAEEYKGQWVRPISAVDKCELSNRDICYSNGQMPRLLDVISIAVKEHASKNHQQENWIIDKTVPWKKVGELPIDQLPDLCDNTQTIWVNDHDSTFGLNDKVPTAIAHKKITSSLLLIQPENVTYKVGIEHKNKKKVRAYFKFKGQDYAIAVTDYTAEQYYLTKKLGIYDGNKMPLFYCVSLAEDYYDYCFKLIAGIIQY